MALALAMVLLVFAHAHAGVGFGVDVNVALAVHILRLALTSYPHRSVSDVPPPSESDHRKSGRKDDRPLHHLCVYHCPI